MSHTLPNLKSLAEDLTHVVLLFDESDGGTCYLGLGCNRLIEIGGELKGIDVFESLQKFSESNTWTFGWIGYDLKNYFLDLSTEIENGLGLPDLAWWEPEVVIRWSKGDGPNIIQGNPESELAKQGLDAIKGEFKAEEYECEEMVWAWGKEDYTTNYNAVKELIQAGDVYELNLCKTLLGMAPRCSSWDLFGRLYTKTKAPFSAYLQCCSSRVMSGSPERFLKREGGKLISQPIKGTIARGINEDEDLKQIEALKNSEKERAENIMIADLVRNDLSRVAKRDSVEVVDLCGIHTFETVHQMITEVQCEIEPHTSLADILKATFPMGSMTGAPKISAMKNIDRLEAKGRGVYSGSAGYISPNGSFDFNVLIRSLFHNAETEKIEASVGGAITFLSNAEDEFNECGLKAEALIKTVKGE